MAIPRWLSLPSVSAFINVCCIFLLCFNLFQNHVFFHEGAIRQSATLTQADQHLPPTAKSSSATTIRGGASSIDVNSPIGMVIPRGKAIAMPSIKISEEEEMNIKRDQYGGKGDKPHLGGFTEFDVRVAELIRCTTDFIRSNKDVLFILPL
jgi:hypothetical protein